MGFLKKKIKKQGFELVEESKSFTLQSESKSLENVISNDIVNFLNNLFDNDCEFVILTAPGPIQGVSFIQATLDEKGIYVELAIVKDDHSYLYNKILTEVECVEVFKNFYDYGLIPDTSEYKPTEF